MRKAIRVTSLVVISYLIQSTVLPYFKINGMALDLMMITLYTIGYVHGFYVGITGGILAALIMEVVSGDLSGLIALSCVGAGTIGAWVASRLAKLKLDEKRVSRRLLKRIAPMLLLAAPMFAKDTVYLLYFYLTGVEITFSHIAKLLFSGFETVLVSLLLMPVIAAFLTRRPEQTLIAKWIKKRREAHRPKPMVKRPTMPPPETMPEGGLDR